MSTRNGWPALDPVVVVIAVVVVAAAVVAGAGGWALLAGGLPLLAALGTKPVAAALTARFGLPPRATQERALVLRARSASLAMRRLCRTVPAGPVAERCAEMQRSARAALPTIRALALQAIAVGRLAAGLNLEALEAEREHYARQLAAAPEPRLRSELASSLRSTELQVATARRLRGLAGELAARTRALTISMEALLAGVTEVLALSTGDPTALPDETLTRLGGEVDALRGGLEEAQSFGRQAAAMQSLTR